MPIKINMFLSSGNYSPVNLKQININNLASKSSISALPKAPIYLNGNMIGRVHNVKPGCGSCGKH
jgi:hypothetical protein